MRAVSKAHCTLRARSRRALDGWIECDELKESTMRSGQQPVARQFRAGPATGGYDGDELCCVPSEHTDDGNPTMSRQVGMHGLKLKDRMQLFAASSGHLSLRNIRVHAYMTCALKQLPVSTFNIRSEDHEDGDDSIIRPEFCDGGHPVS